MVWGRSAAKAAAEEIRLDPHDNNTRTFAQLQDLCKDEYSPQEIEDYWYNQMLPIEGGPIHNVVQDPFLTDLSQLQRPSASAQVPSQARSAMDSGSTGPGQPRDTAQPMVSPVEAGNVKIDPFLTAAGVRDMVAVKEDPFMTHQRESKRQQLAAQAAKIQQDSREMIMRVIGDGYVERQRKGLTVLFVLPWLLFTWCLVLGVVLRHYSVIATFFLMGLCALGSATLVLLWLQGQRRGPISFLMMGLLCLIAVLAGGGASIYGWDHYWRQFWWTHTGFRSSATSAVTPAAARADYSVMNFWSKNESTTFNETRVDHLKSAGYKDTDYFCVAPILAPASAGATIVRVNFWAMGINCCQRYGGFTCDDSRKWDAGLTVVMLNGGMPCPTCNVDKFKKAVAKAEAVHGLVSADDAVFVRWVNESTHLETWMTVWAIFYVLMCIGIAALFFYVFGGISWYYGLGISDKRNEVFGLASYTPNAEKNPDMS